MWLLGYLSQGRSLPDLVPGPGLTQPNGGDWYFLCRAISCLIMVILIIMCSLCWTIQVWVNNCVLSRTRLNNSSLFYRTVVFREVTKYSLLFYLEWGSGLSCVMHLLCCNGWCCFYCSVSRARGAYRYCNIKNVWCHSIWVPRATLTSAEGHCVVQLCSR